MTDKPDSAQSSGHSVKRAGVPARPAEGALRPTPKPWFWPALLLLAALAAAVFFWLPSQVQPLRLPEQSDSPALAAPQTLAADETAPWQEALWARERKEAQAQLAALLDKQFALEERAVKRWAPEPYAAIAEQAREADARYRAREYAAATAGYSAAAAALDGLLAQSETVYRQALADGEGALQQGMAQAALQAYELALAIFPQSADARLGYQRAQRLPELRALIEQAAKLYQAADFDQALRLYETVQAGDPAMPEIQARIDQCRQQIALRDFNQAMGEGFSALHNSAYDRAQQRFEQALALQVDSQRVREALQQLSEQRQLSEIDRLQRQAQQLESAEDWAQALSRYQSLQAIDDSLVLARVGAIRTRARLELDQRLEAALTQPQRLSDQAVFQQAQSLLDDARNIAAPGQRLQRQTRDLAALLSAMKTPVEVLFLSDKQTSVVVYQVARLGQFEQKRLALTPGTYTVVGSREGFRDVRLSVEVALGQRSLQVTVQCQEKI